MELKAWELLSDGFWFLPQLIHVKTCGRFNVASGSNSQYMLLMVR